MRHIFRIFSIAILLTGCNAAGTWIDDHIDSSTKNEIKKLNDQLIDGIAEQNPEKIYEICSDNSLATFKTNMVDVLKRLKEDFSKEKYSILNQFYQVNSTVGKNGQVMTGVTGDHDYIINYKIMTNKTYIIVGTYEYESTITALVGFYGKFDNGWKLYALKIGWIKKLNKDAYDWYLSSKQLFDKGYLIDAVNDMTMAFYCLTPIEEKGTWQYQKEKEIMDYSQKLKLELDKNYSFPKYIENIKSRPEIFNIYPETFKEGVMAPIIQYASTISQQDTTSLSKECSELHSQIGKIFKGLDINNKYIFYQAFEKVPQGQESVKRFGFIRENKQ